jgi:hypothetical protein
VFSVHFETATCILPLRFGDQKGRDLWAREKKTGQGQQTWVSFQCLLENIVLECLFLREAEMSGMPVEEKEQGDDMFVIPVPFWRTSPSSFRSCF